MLPYWCNCAFLFLRLTTSVIGATAPSPLRRMLFPLLVQLRLHVMNSYSFPLLVQLRLLLADVCLLPLLVQLCLQTYYYVCISVTGATASSYSYSGLLLHLLQSLCQAASLLLTDALVWSMPFGTKCKTIPPTIRPLLPAGFWICLLRLRVLLRLSSCYGGHSRFHR